MKKYPVPCLWFAFMHHQLASTTLHMQRPWFAAR